MIKMKRFITVLLLFIAHMYIETALPREVILSLLSYRFD